MVCTTVLVVIDWNAADDDIWAEDEACIVDASELEEEGRSDAPTAELV